MRPLESYTTYLSLYLLWHDVAPGAALVVGALALLLLAHLWLEKPRWQLTALYAFAAYAVHSILFPSATAAPIQPSSWSFVLLSFVVVMASAALACLFPVARFPALGGPFKAVGVVQRFLPTDYASKRHAETKARWSLPEGVQDAQHYPALGLTVFYPSALQPHPQEAAQGLKFLTSKAVAGLAGFLSMPKAIFSYVTLARIRAVPELPLATEVPVPAAGAATGAVTAAPGSDSSSKLPVVLFSHGLGGTATMYSSQCSELASQGYLVFALTHNDGSAALAELDSDVSVVHRASPGAYGTAAADTLRKAQVLTRVTELSLLLDAICEAEESGEWPFSVPFAGRLDLSRVGLMGHSFGAATATLMASRDPRVKALVAHDLWMLPIPESVRSEGIRGPPTLVTQSDEWTEWKANHAATTELVGASRDARLLQMLGTRHSNYSDVPMFSQMLSRKMRAIGAVDFREGMRHINDTSVEFLRRTLVTGEPDTKAPMFERLQQQKVVRMLLQSKQ